MRVGGWWSWGGGDTGGGQDGEKCDANKFGAAGNIGQRAAGQTGESDSGGEADRDTAGSRDGC